MALEARGLSIAENTREQIEEHLAITKGFVRTRFPPEPNGYLHVGHAKSINMNFEGAFEKLNIPKEKRFTYLRFDDTNPEAEKMEYIDSIKEDVSSLGWTPDAITYSSEYFDQMYEMALQLIRQGDAYVCHQSKDEIEACRNILKQRVASGDETELPTGESPYRNRSVSENLIEFERMRRGEYEEREASLRLKFDLTSPNPNLWDPVAYRVKYCAHPHIGDRWCIYPTYDYTHCIVDSLEHIDYSICTLEFETRRESYYLLLDKLQLYKPKVYEFARLNLTGTVLSKRKLKYLVENQLVCGWNDPRMPTLSGLRRLGFNGTILNTFCREIGVTRVESTLQMGKLHATARSILGDTAPRAMAVLDPIKVTLENYEGFEMKTVPDFPQSPDSSETHEIVFGKVLYIDASDFRMEDSPDYFGLAPNKLVGLKYAYNITCTCVVTDPVSNKVVELFATVDLDKTVKPKGHISWVSYAHVAEKAMPRAQIRLFEPLLLTQDETNDDWTSLLNPNSKRVYSNAIVDVSVAKSSSLCFQFERVGYFVLDSDDSTEKCKVFNRTVALRESSTVKTSNASRRDEQEKQLADKMAKLSLDPREMFRKETDKYSKFDQDGIPTHDGKGEPLSKSLFKKLKKEWQKQSKLFQKQ